MSKLPILKDFHNEIDRLFERLFSRSDLSSGSSGSRNFFPEVDIKENEKQYQIKANLPGIDEKDIEVYFDKGTLYIQGKYSSEKEEKDNNYIKRERAWGEFSRNFNLPNADTNAEIEAKIENGVLKITIPKSKASDMKRIKIQS